MGISYEMPDFHFSETHCKDGKFISKDVINTTIDTPPSTQPSTPPSTQPSTDDENFWIDRGFRLMGKEPSEAYGGDVEASEPIHCFEEALKKNPKSMTAHYGKACAEFNAGEYSDVEHSIAKALGIDEYDPRIWYIRSVLSAHGNDYNDVKYCFEFIRDLENVTKSDREKIKEVLDSVEKILNQSK